MNTWFRKLGLSVLVVTLAGVLGGCDDNGNALIRLFFGINGSGNCDRVIVTVDLAAANAVISRDNEGALECVLNAQLAAAGCDLNLTEEGDTLIATIDACSIPAVTGLISCLFETVDISSLQGETSAQCDCHSPGCDTHPPVCISPDPDPTACEDCNNGIDDDHNGLVDCDDPNCRYSPYCDHVTTTTTSSSTTSTTESSTTTSSTITTTTSTTSTTIPLRWDCNLVFRLNDDSSVGALQWDTAYDSAPGQFVGSAGDVDCAALPGAGDVIFSANDKEGQKVLTIGMTGVEGFTGPVDIAQCRFKASTVPVAEDYDITVVDASDPEGTPIFPLPPVTLHSIQCTNTDTTTTTAEPVTTTTEQQVTTTTTGNTTTTEPTTAGKYLVTFSLDNAVTYGALQLTIGYGSAPGEFTGTGATVVCSKISAAGNAAFNDNEVANTLGLGWISLDGSTGPLTLTVCEFDATETPVPGDFTVTIEDAVDPDFNPITAVIGKAIAPKL